MTARRRFASWRAVIGGLLVLSVCAAACGDDTSETTTDPSTPAATDGGADQPAELSGTLRIGAIPDQDPDLLLRNNELLADQLAAQLPGVSVQFVPVIDYQAAVNGFRVGDLDLVWFGGLTGVQARLEVDGATAIAQRDIDDNFTSVFIARRDAGIDEMTEVADLASLAGRSLTFGSDSSTSGRLMPQYFLAEAGVDVDTDLDGPVGYSGSHDATIEVVAAGSYEVGALNSQVWDARVADGTVDPSVVVEVFRTPEYYDYHWVARPDLDQRHGEGALQAITDALLAIDGSDQTEQALLEYFGAGSFIPTDNANYAAIEAVARQIGAIRE